MIVTDILSNLPSLLYGPSQNGRTVLQALLQTIRVTLEMEQPDTNKLVCLLEETAHLVKPVLRSTSTSEPHSQPIKSIPVADGMQILEFFSNHSLLDLVPEEVGLKVIGYLCTACDSASIMGKNKRHIAQSFLSLAPTMLRVRTQKDACRLLIMNDLHSDDGKLHHSGQV